MKYHHSNINAVLARGQIYRTLSQAFHYPDQEFETTFHDGSFSGSLRKAAEQLPPVFELKEVVATFLGALESMPEQVTQLQAEYIRLLAHSMNSRCPPYETEYEAEHVFAKTREMADIAGFYRAFGVQPSSAFREPPDHVGAELEFMHLLAMKEAYARTNHWEDKAGICADAQRRFLEDHLGRWLPLFTQILEASTDLQYYRTLAKLASEFIKFDCKFLDVEPVLLKVRISPVIDEKAISCP